MFDGVDSQSGELQERLGELAKRRRGGEIGDAPYAALYFLHWQAIRHGRRFASRKFKRDPRPDPVDWMTALGRLDGGELDARLIHYFERYGFLGVIPNVCASLCAWLQGRWAIGLCEHIPTPAELLRMQVRGARAVTILSEYPRLLRPVLNKPDAFAFMIHDLEHAYKFFHDPDLHSGQRRFFAGVLKLMERGTFDNPMRDRIFAEKFNYLIGDMNTHILHGLQYLKAILIEHYLRDEGKSSRETLSQASRAELDAVMRSFDAYRARAKPVLSDNHLEDERSSYAVL